MFKLDKENALLISSDIKDWQTKYTDVENLPIEFYLKYRNILSAYKNAGKSKEEVLCFFQKISEDNQDSSEFVNEILDLITDFCRPDYQIWK
ncbi:MAG: hypothetical protein HXK22_00345 [Alloprevotella tannerae]|jgi:hypothetical protein|nr:hypothetical protein [Alloprevotella tannerae]